MSKYSIAEFIKNTEQEDKGEGLFELETPRMLEVNLNGMVWAKAGSMVAYNGRIKYEREGILEHGIGNLFKKALTGEGASLMKANGQGKLYLADSGKKIIILQLQNEAIYVNGNDLLAFEPSLRHDIKLMKRVAGMMAGGLFNVRCEGSGMLAITTHYEPLTLRVTPGKPVVTDPNATVAWSGNLKPEFQTDISFKTFVGRGSGESIQMRFEGDGFVIVQPYEEVYMQQSNG
ncbi:AIM24 family protein [Bacillus sp. JJ1562]|uniref:AIM24 family protein n=1 Tax=Bacillus sp. JJ1562 TaxID=3122960 RepID=UPI00300116E8